MTASGPEGEGARRVAENPPGSNPVWYSLLFGPPFRLVGFLYRTFHSNRRRLDSLLSGPRASSLVRKILVLTLVLWVAVWLTASEDSRNRLTEAAKQHFRNFGSAIGR